MTEEICFTADWLDKKRKELKGVDPGLLERALLGMLNSRGTVVYIDNGFGAACAASLIKSGVKI
jgi:hypothetical protein